MEAPKLAEDEATRLLHEQNGEQLDKLQLGEAEGKEEAEGDEEDDDEEEDGNGTQKAGEAGKKKRKKKKKPAKKKGNKGPAGEAVGEAGAAGSASTPSPPLSRLLGGTTNYFMKYGQTFPPTRPVSELFPRGGFPVGDIQPHGKTKYPHPQSTWAKTTEEERR